MSLIAGTRLGGYEIRARIGAGGMGEVYRARDLALARDVAVKVLPDDVARDPDRLARFEREARALAALVHPNILTIYAFGVEGGVAYAATELVEGETLRERLQRGPLPRAEAVDLAATIADALAAAHARHIVHRDLKPENVLIADDGRIKVIDFGLAMRQPVAAATYAPTAEIVTAPGAVLGSPGYMAPEQVCGDTTDHRADIFALGCVTYELVTGKPAFARPSLADSVRATLQEPAPELPASGVRDAGDLQRIIGRCLEKSPERRFQSCSDLAFALREFVRQAQAPVAAATDDRTERPSIAVLPFANLSADPEQDYFCCGIAEEIINALVHVDGLRVLARTSSFAFKGRHEDVREIGARLGAGLIVDGSVRRSGDRLRVTAQLVQVADGSHLWSERYDRPTADVFAVQDEIALAVVDKLKVSLLARERRAMRRRPAGNLLAYDAYLKGIFHWNRLSVEAFAESRVCFEEAIRLDPDLVPAYVFLGQAYASGAFWADIEPAPAADRASALVEQALALDPDCAEAHVGKGNIAGYFGHDWPYAEACTLHALQLSPSLATAHLHLTGLYTILRRFDEAMLEARLTLRLDPVSPTTGAWAAFWLASAGARDEGVEALREIAEGNPSYWMPWWELAVLCARLGDTGAALEYAERAAALSENATHALAVLACVHYREGNRRAGDELYDRLQARARQGFVSPSSMACVEVGRGDSDKALETMRRAAAINDPMLPFWRMGIASVFPADPRFEQVLASVGL